MVKHVRAGRGERLSDFLFLTIANKHSTTLFRCIYVKKVMKLVAFIFEHPSYRFADEKHCHAFVFLKVFMLSRLYQYRLIEMLQQHRLNQSARNTTAPPMMAFLTYQGKAISDSFFLIKRRKLYIKTKKKHKTNMKINPQVIVQSVFLYDNSCIVVLSYVVKSNGKQYTSVIWSGLLAIPAKHFPNISDHLFIDLSFPRDSRPNYFDV